MNISPDFKPFLRAEALDLPESGIVEVMNVGRNRQGLIPLWVGEGDEPTPQFIKDAALASLAAGETFYTYQRGLPELRQTIADYCTRHYGPLFDAPFSHERFFVTGGGMHAIQIAVRMVAGLGDEVLVPTPAWPNFTGALIAAGVKSVEVPMQLAAHDGGSERWCLDPEALRAAITPRTRALIINSPSNPTGWTATLNELAAFLDLAREHDLWIIADEIYGRITFEGPRTPSLHDLITPQDKVLFVQTLSKNWSMTGWRIGWIEAPPQLGQIIENLVQYSSSGTPVVSQRAAIAALRDGDFLVETQIAKLRHNRDLLCEALGAIPGVHFATPPAAFYLFCRFDAHPDTRKLALRLVEEANVGVAPGATFGEIAAPYIRMCFARKTPDIVEVARRLKIWLAAQ